MKGSLGRNKEGKLVSHFTSESQGIAFRGDGDDKDGNFQQITRLVSRHIHAMKNWLESKDAKSFHTTYICQENLKMNLFSP